MDFPNVSILTPTWNRRKFLPLMVHNINSFEYDKNKLEWVICDDHPENPLFTRETLEMTKKSIYPVKIKYIYRPTKHLTIGEKRNYLVKQATHKYLANMDDDDIYCPEYLKYSIGALMDKKYSLVGSPQMLFIYPYHNYKFTYIQCAAKRQAHEATMCFTKKHFRNVGGFKKIGTGEGGSMVDGLENKCGMTEVQHCMICVSHKDNTCSKDEFLDKEVNVEIGRMQGHIDILKMILP
jgi:cellulose synthase/poly-beta-1,6-N-acetylglucosamine synthase-like glycosyltransferase